MKENIIIENKKVLHDYDILEKYEAGIVLIGHEVKSVKNGNIKLKSAFVTFYKGEPFLTNAHITKYKGAGSILDYDPDRSRKLLLKKREIKRILGKSSEKGLTIVPISVYTKGSKIKVEIAVAHGKKQYEKKEKIKKKDLDREVMRTLKSNK